MEDISSPQSVPDPRPMQLLVAERFEDPVVAAGYFRTLFEQVASGERPPTVSITPSARHVGVTRRDTHREGFREAVRAADELGYPALVRGSGGGATAADTGTFGFSIIRDGMDSGRGINARYTEAEEFVLGAFRRLGFEGAEVGEVRDEFCPGDHSLRFGDYESGMKLVGIAQRITRRATSVGGIVLVSGEEELARVLERVYGAMDLPFRRESVGSLQRAGAEVTPEETIAAFAAEARERYSATDKKLDAATLANAREVGTESLQRP